MHLQRHNGRTWISTIYSLQPDRFHFMRYRSQGQTLPSSVIHYWDSHTLLFLWHSVEQSSTLFTHSSTRVFEQPNNSLPCAMSGHASMPTCTVWRRNVLNINAPRSNIKLSHDLVTSQHQIGILTGSMWIFSISYHL